MKKELKFVSVKPVPGYEDYMVYEDGAIFSIKTDRFLKPSITRDGYLTVCLSRNGEQKTFYVHKLVAQAFVPNPRNISTVNHKDYNKKNNNASNLRWATINEVEWREFVPVRCIETNQMYLTAREAARQTGINGREIILATNNENKTAGGYHWHCL